MLRSQKTLKSSTACGSPPTSCKTIGQRADADLYQASIGIHLFKREVLKECLDNDFADFGKNIIPAAIKRYKVQAYI